VLTGRILTGLAALVMLALIILNVLPNPGSSDTGPERVNCGTILVDSRYTGDQGCDTQFGIRFVWSFFLWLATLVLGTIGLVLLRREVRYT
jgi:hypothetical protein